VRRQIEQLLSSPDFDASRRSKGFLRFIVEEALAGRGEDLTQSAIATRVFERHDFDPVVDPIVRIQAGRLRRSLERYYLLSGKQESLRIELPRGTYVPAFRLQADPGPKNDPDHLPAPAASGAPADDWPSVAVAAFEMDARGPQDAALALRLQEELVLELARYGSIRPCLQFAWQRGGSLPSSSIRFSVMGRLHGEGSDLRVSARLVDHATGEHLWGDEYHTASRPGRWSGPPEDIARVIAARLGGEEGIMAQHLGAERRKTGRAPVSAYDALLLSYEFFLVRNPETLAPAIQWLRRSLEADPSCGPVWTRLARLFISNYTFDVTQIPTPLDEAITYAQRGVRLNPGSRIARCMLANALAVKGELAAARYELQEALKLSPGSLVYLENLGYNLTLVGEGQHGVSLIREARKRNPYCQPFASVGLWLEHLRQGEIEAANRAALEYLDPTYYWRAFMRACCLGLLDRGAEAEMEVADLLQRRPDFAERGRALIGRLVKLPDVMSLIVEGMARAGLKLA